MHPIKQIRKLGATQQKKKKNQIVKHWLKSDIFMTIKYYFQLKN